MDVHTEICRAIDSYKSTAVDIGRQIHARPELKFKEEFAAGLLSAALSGLGLNVETGTGNLETAFRAEFGRSGPTVAILAEYDALPNGHSCGHNLIAGAALSAIAGLKHVQDQIPGRVVILGTPGEEGGGGKILLLRAGALEGVDAAMMAHPIDGEYRTMPALATQHLRLTFHGRASHAAVAPWDGASALAAVIQTFQTVDTARLHLREGSRVHGIITDGGQAVNIIPERAACEFLARAKTSHYAAEIAARIIRCAEAAASATGTRLEHELIGGYKNMINNLTIAARYAHHCEAFGIQTPEAPAGAASGSTDMGDVSHEIPSIHPVFAISDRRQGNCHEDAFEKLTDTPRAYESMIRVAKTMAMTAYDLLADPELLKAAKEEFSKRIES